MSELKLPEVVDAVIVGTGMTESLLAAALARAGYTVAHFDRNNYYGGDWTTFNLETFVDWLEVQKDVKLEVEGLSSLPETSAVSMLKGKNEKLVHLQTNFRSICNVEEYPTLSEAFLLMKTTNLKQRLENFNENSMSPNVSDENSVESPNILTTSISAADSTEKPKDSLVDAASEAISSLAINSTKSESTTKNDCEKKALDDSPNSSSFSVPEHKNDADDTEKAIPTPACLEKVCENDAKSNNEVKEEISLNSAVKAWRKFSIDLAPKILYCSGPLVELLISSDVAKYCEFRCITRVLTLIVGKVEKVPCSRADVFSSKHVPLIEKRMLMKFLTFCLEYEKHPEEYCGYEALAFVEFLRAKKMTPKVQHFVQHGIAMVTDSVTTLAGLEATRKFLKSLGRYGNTAFLWPLYGSGELPQAFCRMCAVFAGIYCLRAAAQYMVVEEEDNKGKESGEEGVPKCAAVVMHEGQRIDCKWLVMNASYAQTMSSHDQIASSYVAAVVKRRLSRCILLTDRSVMPEENEDPLSVLCLSPPLGGSSPINVLELSYLSMTCPQGYYLVHMTTIAVRTAKEDFEPAINALFGNCTEVKDLEVKENHIEFGKPTILWSLYFNVDVSCPLDKNASASSKKQPENVLLLSGPDSELDFDDSVAEAKEAFQRICPGEEFIPKAPNPEDIICDDAQENQPRSGGYEASDRNSFQSFSDGLHNANESNADGSNKSSDIVDEVRCNIENPSKDICANDGADLSVSKSEVDSIEAAESNDTSTPSTKRE